MMYDVCVIGGGPAGMFSSYYASSRSLKTILIDANSKLGGRLNYYLQMPLYDVPGEFGTKTHELLNRYIKQLYKSDALILLNTAVLEVKKQETHFTVKTSKKLIEAKAIIVATGNGIIQNKELKTTKADEETLKKISYEVKEEEFNLYKKVAIIGHTPMAIDWAIQFAQNGVQVSLYETKPLQLQPILMNQLNDLPIERFTFNTVKGICFKKEVFEIDEAIYEKVFSHLGTTKQSICFSDKLVSLDNGITSVQGLFIAGDARNEHGKLKLIHGATHDAMQAVNEANQYLNKEDFYQPIVSTHHPIFKEWSK